MLIERNPYEVFASNLKLWRTLTELYALEPVSSEEIEQFVLAAYLLHEKAIAAGVNHLQPQQFARVRYEDLLANAVTEVGRLYQELNFDNFHDIGPNLEIYLKKVSGHRRNRFQISATQKARVDELWGSLIAEKHYTWPDKYLEVV